MIWLYYILLILISLAGLGLVAVTLPGLWLMAAAAAIFALVTHERGIGPRMLLVLFILSLVAEILEFNAGGAAARKAGGGRSAAVGAVVGGIVGGIAGSFVLPLVLTIIGVCVGSLAGAAVVEFISGGGAEPVKALEVGWGAAKGRFFGVVLKLAFGLAMLLMILVAGFP